MQSRMWKNYVVTNMQGYNATLDQCAYGINNWKRGVNLGHTRKQTRIRITSYHFAIGISKKCRCNPRGSGLLFTSIWRAWPRSSEVPRTTRRR